MRGIVSTMTGSERGGRGLFEPDVCLPAMVPRRYATLTSERRLLLAVLEEALQCLRLRATVDGDHCHRGRVTVMRATRSRKREQIRDEAVRWIESDDDTYVFSFVCICEHLGFEPAAIRKALDACDWRPTEPWQRLTESSGTRTTVTAVWEAGHLAVRRALVELNVAGWTSAGIAARLGVSQQHVSQWRLGQKRPRRPVQLLEQLAVLQADPC